MGWALWFLIACVVIAVLLAGAGAVTAFRAARALRLHVDDVVPHELLVRLTAAQNDTERLVAAVAGFEALPSRANAALASMNASLRAMRLPQAVAALRLAGVAVRLLLAR